MPVGVAPVVATAIVVHCAGTLVPISTESTTAVAVAPVVVAS